MHDIKWIREHKEEFDAALGRRGLPVQADSLIAMDERRRAAIQRAEAALARRNIASKEIGAAKRSNEEAVAQKLQPLIARNATAITHGGDMAQGQLEQVFIAELVTDAFRQFASSCAVPASRHLTIVSNLSQRTDHGQSQNCHAASPSLTEKKMTCALPTRFSNGT